MAVYAIGDIQGCYDPLRRLLDLLRFDPTADTLWLVGDLVNRGPRSVDVLRLIKGLGDQAVAVLGNHDLTLLAVAAGYVKPKRKDTFHSILDAPDREELLAWLRHRPLLHHDPLLGFTLIHAGLPPQWDLALAQGCAAAVEATLQGVDCHAFLKRMFGGEPVRWRDDLAGYDRRPVHDQRLDSDAVLHGGRHVVLYREGRSRQSNLRLNSLVRGARPPQRRS